MTKHRTNKKNFKRTRAFTTAAIRGAILISMLTSILTSIVHKPQLKAPIYIKWNRKTYWYDIISNKIRPKLSLFWVRFGSSKQLTKANFLGEFVLAPKHLWATIGLWRLRNQWVYSGAPPSLTHYLFFSVCFSSNKCQAGEHHLQVTSNINTLCRIAELPQIYPHLYDRSRRDFKDSEKAFNS